MTEFFTTKELAARWKVPKERIWTWLSTGEPLPKSFKKGNQRLFNIKDILLFEKLNTHETSID